VPTKWEPAQEGSVAADASSQCWDPHGPYVKSAVFNVMWNSDAQVAALLSGTIDHISDAIAPEYLDQLRACPDIALTFTPRLGFVSLLINCQRYPFSIPAFRRALAFAMDKREIAGIMKGELGFALDTPIPPSCAVWRNNATTPDFTTSDVPAARAELAAAGFVDRDSDGYVEAPNGTSFAFHLEHSTIPPETEAALQAAKRHWDEAGLPVELVPTDCCSLIGRLETLPRDYDGAWLGYTLSEPLPLDLKVFHSKEISNPYGNLLNWANASYDACMDAMMNATSYEEAITAAHAAQQVIVENCPMIVVYSNYEVNAHRTDKFEGWVVSPGYGTGPQNPWNPRKVRLVQGQPDRDPRTGLGGTLATAISQDIDTQNPLTTCTPYGEWILKQVYTSLTGDTDPRDHSVMNCSGLATAWTTRDLPQGREFTFTLVDNATWHDGTPVTSEDIAFSYNYIKNHSIPTYYYILGYLNACAVIDATHVSIITNSKSYWAFQAISNWVILPKHIWEGILDPICFTNPDPVGCGPFKWGSRVEDETLRLDRWELYHYRIAESEPPPPPVPLLVYLIVGGVTVVAVVLVGSIWYWRRQPQPKPLRG